MKRRNDSNDPLLSPFVPAPPRHRAPKKPLYHPSVYEFHCRGSLHLSTKKSADESKNDYNREGACHGLKSRLQHVEDWPASTKEEAIKFFHYSTSSHQPPVLEPSDEDSNASLSLESFPIKQAIIYHDENKENEKLPIVLPSWHEWSSYGSTCVRLLVLKEEKSKQEKIVGVAPDCSLGVSIRDVGMEVSGKRKSAMTVTSLHAIALDVSKVDHFEAIDMDDSTMNNKNDAANSPSKEDTESNPRRKQSSVWDMSKRIVVSMNRTAGVLREAVADDFPSRTVKAGRKIAAEFGKTVDRTTKLVSKIMDDYWRGD